MTVVLTDPTSPNSASPTTLYVGFSSGYCLDIASTYVRSGNDFALTLTEGRCPFEPPGFNFAPFHVGVLAPGTYSVNVVELDAGIQVNTGSFSFQVSSVTSAVPSLSIGCSLALALATVSIAAHRLVDSYRVR